MRDLAEIESVYADLENLVRAAASPEGGGFSENQQLIAAWSILRWVLGKESPQFSALIRKTRAMLHPEIQ